MGALSAACGSASGVRLQKSVKAAIARLGRLPTWDVIGAYRASAKARCAVEGILAAESLQTGRSGQVWLRIVYLL